MSIVQCKTGIACFLKVKALINYTEHQAAISHPTLGQKQSIPPLLHYINLLNLYNLDLLINGIAPIKPHIHTLCSFQVHSHCLLCYIFYQSRSCKSVILLFYHPWNFQVKSLLNNSIFRLPLYRFRR